ncbi:MAG: apolipoprotein N-acyltransferase [Desulfobacterales bacterium]|uniref:Apolipoprotein N-acyltransferase n=1 Tax=Candidatus Desulfaltia bathyphila TaxID=2841697 RepID=A0A8J6N6D3_9BACT|nr:apolipoprotein N-acyltransferase [Candidatus Desulfaltia bathyphila]MBL7195081.1 apolipoprotein N-acyltransferase [Desulfobacterales bacterium]MBL7206994.1 apolipoprotein N-acyltransferase [Desulfobacterales bacterium]
MQTQKINKLKLCLAILSGLLLTGSFPKPGISLLVWFALVPFLVAIRNLSPKRGFILGFIAGLVHYLTLLYWFVYTMHTYGHLPMALCVFILILASAFLALYLAAFSATLLNLCAKPAICIFAVPVLWVSFEYMRSLFFLAFPWELIGYSQYNNLLLIQISDIFGVYGVSFLIGLSNAAIFLAFLYLAGKDWKRKAVTKRVAVGSISVFALIVVLVLSYGKWRIDSIDRLVCSSPSINVAVVQGNIDQAIKWNPEFQRSTVKKYIKLSLLSKADNPDIVVWPETATPFYFLYNIGLSNMVKKGINDTGTTFLFGSPSFISGKGVVEYYNTAYLVSRDGKVYGKYDKVHLVPFGEYIPFNKWLPFVGKMVEGVGDFKSGIRGKTIQWGDYSLGLQICYEIIFPDLSRAMVKNNATLLVNITNDAWFGTTSAPYQHFSMAIFRAVENRRALVRSANTGISGFIDPVGRIIKKTDLFKEAVITRSVPLMGMTSFYTRFGDLFAIVCMFATAICFVLKYVYNIKLRD